MTEDQKLVVLRAIDKLDRVGTDGVRRLLTEGRIDPVSGAFTAGAGLTGVQADLLLEFLASRRDSNEATLAAMQRWFLVMAMPVEDLERLGKTLGV